MAEQHHEQLEDDVTPLDRIDEGGLDPGRLTLVGMYGAVITFIAICAMQFFFFALEQSQLTIKGAADPSAMLINQVAQQQDDLDKRTSWLDQTKGIARIPVKRAMVIAIEKYNSPAAKAGAPIFPVTAPAAPAIPMPPAKTEAKK